MIDKELLTQTVTDALQGTELFLVDLTVSPDNRIVVEIDSTGAGVDIDSCAALTRAIEEKFDRDAEDYELEVGSAGLTAPFKVRGQWLKNLGNEVELLTTAGRKLTGTLTAVDADTFTVEIPTKVKKEGAKRPVVGQVPATMPYTDIKSAKYHITFK